MKSITSKTSWFFGAALSALLVLGTPFSAHAVDLISGGSATLVPAALSYESEVVDASGHENLIFSFSYNAESIDGGDSFEYGWNDGGNHSLGTISGVNEGGEGAASDETGVVSVSLPVEAQVANLKVYVSGVFAAGDDEVSLTSIQISGDVVPQISPVVIGEVGYDSLGEAIAAAQADNIIELNADITTSAQVTINKSVTIDGKGHVLFAPFAKTDNDNNSAIGIKGVDGAVVIQNLTIDGTGSSGFRHGINVYESNGVTLDTVTLANNNAAGLIVNSSTVTANNLNTNGNVWYGVNVDKNATGDAIFTLTGSGVIAEPVQIITDKTVGAIVTADGYDAYTIDGTTKTLWTNKELTNAVTIEGENVIYSTIQAAINATSTIVPGTIIIGVGTYPENITVSKPLTLVGAGESTILSGVVVNASDVTLRDLRIEKTGLSGNAIQVTGASVENLTIDGVVATGANTGLKVDNATSLIGLDVADSSFDGNTFGWYFSHHPNTGTTVTNVVVSGSSFSDNLQKGIYVEKLDNALFENIEVIDSGTDSSNHVNNGIDINLKWAAYSNITIRDSVVSGSGLAGTAMPFDPAGIAIKGRDDAPSYASPAGTLSGVTLENVTVSGGVVGIRLGEEGKNNAGPSGVTISGSSLSGTGGLGLVNATHSAVTATGNWWGTAVAEDVTALVSGAVEFTPWCSVEACTATSTGTEIQAIIEDAVEEILATGAGAVTVEIPAGTAVTGPAEWDGTVSAPTIVTTTVEPDISSNQILSVIQSIEVGAGELALTFDQPVKLVFSGQANALVGWSRNGVFTEITATCDSTTSPTLADGADCKTVDGTDLIVWTKHFTTFTTYTTSSRSTGGGSAGRASVNAQPAAVALATPAGQVLGEETFRFVATLRVSKAFNASVTELQKRLLADGINPGPLDGLFGPKTLAAVKAFQTARGLRADGIVGPLTNAELNKAPAVAALQQ